MDEVSISKAEANICIDAKELFEGASGISLNGLQYTKAENKSEWERRKDKYSLNLKLPTLSVKQKPTFALMLKSYLRVLLV